VSFLRMCASIFPSMALPRPLLRALAEARSWAGLALYTSRHRKM
jgi:hypothetical protein